jgi:hypothetical protein
MYYKKSQKKYKNAFRLSKINIKKKLIGGKPPKVPICDNIEELQRSAMNYNEDVRLCLGHVDNLLLRFQGGIVMNESAKRNFIRTWCDIINMFIMRYNLISNSNMDSVFPRHDPNPESFKQILLSLKQNFLRLSIELNQFLEEINVLIKLDITKSKELQTRYLAKFTCPNPPLPSLNI